jgi:glycosyltransferase involved in cell wall biosynthesis
MDRIVSIIIPCYNGEKFIDQSIESVYIQDYTPIELIVVDDESTDGSAARINA